MNNDQKMGKDQEDVDERRVENNHQVEV